MSEIKMYQVSTLQALTLGYTREVIKVRDLLQHGNIGLGTFEDVNGEMIVLDGHCYQADNHGNVTEAAPDTGVPFAIVTECRETQTIPFEDIRNIDQMKQSLDLHIDYAFTLNSMHLARIDGVFDKVMARSETGLHAHHVTLKELLQDRQKDFVFENIRGTIIAAYFPNYMDGINASGWHLHFISEDHTRGGHVFDLAAAHLTGRVETISQIEIQLPVGPAYDTYDMKTASASDIKTVEQGKK